MFVHERRGNVDIGDKYMSCEQMRMSRKRDVAGREADVGELATRCPRLGRRTVQVGAPLYTPINDVSGDKHVRAPCERLL